MTVAVRNICLNKAGGYLYPPISTLYKLFS